jgi:hypothetical protein
MIVVPRMERSKVAVTMKYVTNKMPMSAGTCQRCTYHDALMFLSCIHLFLVPAPWLSPVVFVAPKLFFG